MFCVLNSVFLILFKKTNVLEPIKISPDLSLYLDNHMLSDPPNSEAVEEVDGKGRGLRT